MDKNTILESNGMNIMDYLEKLIDNKSDKETVLNSISVYFANSTTYINDWRTKYRKKRIKEKYQTLKTSNFTKEEIFRKIAVEIEEEFIEKNIYVNITPRVVRHAIESA